MLNRFMTSISTEVFEEIYKLFDDIQINEYHYR